MALNGDSLKSALVRWTARLDEVAPELNALDGKLGDGDLGATLQKCAANVRAAQPDLPDDLGGIFKACGIACTKASGSSFGTLLAVAFLTAAKCTTTTEELAWSELPALLKEVLDALSARGGAKLGDKTVLDAIEAARQAIVGIDDPNEQLKAAVSAVTRAIDNVRDQPNRIGRARMFAERSIGQDDPGMVAFRYMVESLQQNPPP